MRRAPQALLGGESVEVEMGELPRRVELPDQVATGFVGHRLSSPEGSSAVIWPMRVGAAAERQLQRLARGKGGPLGEKLLTLVTHVPEVVIRNDAGGVDAAFHVMHGPAHP